MSEAVSIPRIIIGGAASGIGKTSITVGLTRALRARGIKVAVFKCGPDYLDPTYHVRAAGRASHNLDSWMMGRQAVLGTFARACKDADIALIEGMMGLFDGASPVAEEGSTAQIAKWLSAPVLLIVDAAGIARTLAAIVNGFTAFDRELRIRGVLCNRLGSQGHLELLRQSLSQPPVLGGLPSDPALTFPERHLGLRTADEHAVPDSIFARLAESTSQWCNLAAIIEVANTAPPLECELPVIRQPASTPKCRIGIALDDALHFYYEYNLALLQSLGAELVYFSPVSDRQLPDVDGIYLGGGYPELHAEALSSNRSMREQISEFAAAGGAVYGECGGLMYLSSGITTLDGKYFPMAGVIPGHTTMHERLQALGYVEVETTTDSVIGGEGTRFRGHQFRYSELKPRRELKTAYRMRRHYDGRLLPEGYQLKNVLASYVHAHWASNPAIAEHLVEACARRASSRGRDRRSSVVSRN
ncbi:MAG: cobyrinate a,c-diamide synthase [Deltaproteobacteria bacterium]|nr:cobyrinate a,c-diamide synthase [Deltaproteobacteria bacterium]